MEIYEKLLSRFGAQHWWPANTKEEVIIGTILTQNTAWINVEKAVKNLKNEDICSFNGIFNSNIQVLKKAIKPSGFFNQKSVYLKNISDFFIKNGGIDHLSKNTTENLRQKLLNLKGIGKETADSILLYAFDRDVFVVDTYTKRLVERHNLSNNLNYDNIQKLFENNLDKDYVLFGEYHALIVRNSKEFCRKKPICNGCPLMGV